MSSRVFSFEVITLCTSLACAACAPGTDESFFNSRASAGTQARAVAGGFAGAAAVAAGSYAAGNPAPSVPLPTAGVGSIPTAIGGPAGRGPLAGMPAAGSARGATAGTGSFGSAGTGPIATGPIPAGAAGAPIAGMSGAAGSGTTGTGGPCGSGMPTDGRPTTGPLACIVEEHNAVRAKVMSMTALPPVIWNADMAKYAQEWTDMTCMSPKHRSNPTLNGMRLGENLYASSGLGPTMAGKEAVDGWAGEVACYTYGKFMTADKCDMNCTTQMHSDGCGHYTQVVWRASIQIGCGVTTCGTGRSAQTEVICNYGPAGNFVGQLPY